MLLENIFRRYLVQNRRALLQELRLLLTVHTWRLMIDFRKKSLMAFTCRGKILTQLLLIIAVKMLLISNLVTEGSLL